MTPRAASTRSPVGLWLLASVLVLGAIAAGLSFSSERREADERDRRAVEVAATQLEGVIQQTIAGLRGADALVVDGAMSEVEFQAFSDNVLQQSLFDRLAFVTVLRDDEVPAFEAAHGTTVRDTDGRGGFAPSAPRDEHLVVQYVHPVDDVGRGLVGFDIASDATRAAVAQASATTRSPAIGHIGSLASSTRPGLFGVQAVRLPDGAVVGYVSSGVNVDEVLAVAAAGADPGIDVSVYLDDELVAGSGRRGATEEFEVAGLTVVVEADDDDGIDLVLPVVIIAATGVLALAVVLTARSDRRQRLERERAVERNRAIAELGQRLAAAARPDDIVEEVLDSAGRILEADRVTVGRRTDGDAGFVVVRFQAGASSTAGAPAPRSSSVHSVDLDGPLLTCIRRCEPIVIANFDGTRSLVGGDAETWPSDAGSSYAGSSYAGSPDTDVSNLDPSTGRPDAASARARVAGGPGDRRHGENQKAQGDVHPVICVPLRFYSGYCVGAIGLDLDPVRHRSFDEVLASCTTIAELAARALERAVINQVVQDGASRLSGLARSLASVSTAAEVTAVVESMVPGIVGCSSVVLDHSPIAEADRRGQNGQNGQDGDAVRDTGAGTVVDQVVRDGSGAAIATIALTWRTPVTMSPTLYAVLETIAELIGSTLARAATYDLEHELVTELQTALLPPAPAVDGLEVVVHYEPASAAVGIGGDWYDVIAAPDGHCYSVIGDVSGHGAVAVATMAQLKSVMAHLLTVGTPVHEVLAQADAMLRERHTYATAQVVDIDVDRGSLRVSNAGHPYALVRRANGSVEHLTGGHGPLLGAAWSARDGGVGSARASSDPVAFGIGDLLVMYTDGVVERRRSAIDVQIDAFATALSAIGSGDALGDAIESLVDAARVNDDPTDAPIDDDRAAIAIRRV